MKTSNRWARFSLLAVSFVGLSLASQACAAGEDESIDEGSGAATSGPTEDGQRAGNAPPPGPPPVMVKRYAGFFMVEGQDGGFDFTFTECPVTKNGKGEDEMKKGWLITKPREGTAGTPDDIALAQTMLDKCDCTTYGGVDHTNAFGYQVKREGSGATGTFAISQWEKKNGWSANKLGTGADTLKVSEVEATPDVLKACGRSVKAPPRH